MKKVRIDWLLIQVLFNRCNNLLVIEVLVFKYKKAELTCDLIWVFKFPL